MEGTWTVTSTPLTCLVQYFSVCAAARALDPGMPVYDYTITGHVAMFADGVQCSSHHQFQALVETAMTPSFTVPTTFKVGMHSRRSWGAFSFHLGGFSSSSTCLASP